MFFRKGGFQILEKESMGLHPEEDSVAEIIWEWDIFRFLDNVTGFIFIDYNENKTKLGEQD